MLGTHRSAEAVRQRYRKVANLHRRPSFWTRLQRTSVPQEWRELAYRHKFYLVSSTFYGFSGLLLGYIEHGRAHALLGEPIVWLLQTLFTHKSDVVTLGEDSIWHAIDRLHAYAFTFLRAAYTFYAFYALGAYSQAQATVFFIGLATALCCIRLSWKAVMRRDAAAFLRWHALWHFFLPATALCVGFLF